MRDVHDRERVGDGPVARGAPAAGAASGRPAVRWSTVVAVAAVCGYGWWAVGLAPFSLEASLAVVLAGGAAAVIGWRARRPDGPRAEWRRVAPWLALVATGAAVQLAAYLQHPRDDHPTLSSLTNALLDSHAARAAAFVAWLVAAAGLARQ
jgi:hypothetical protein